MSTPEITRKQAWMKLAVLIADGLPDPNQVRFHPAGEILSIELDTASALAAWARAIGATVDTPHTGSSERWIHPAHGKWQGFSVALVAYAPVDDTEPITEDLTEVRGIEPELSRPTDDTVDSEPDPDEAYRRVEFDSEPTDG